MSFSLPSSADAAAGVLCLLALSKHKREFENDGTDGCKRRKLDDMDSTPTSLSEGCFSSLTPYPEMPDEATHPGSLPLPTTSNDSSDQKIHSSDKVSKQDGSKSHRSNKNLYGDDTTGRRGSRLEKNRVAAKISRDRKKSLVNELQRCVSFFHEANVSLQQQNSELERLVSLAQAHTEKGRQDHRERRTDEKPNETNRIQPRMMIAPASQKPHLIEDDTHLTKTKPIHSRAVDSESSSSLPNVPPLTEVAPGSTMQAMMSFQQAASKAMEAAMVGLQSIRRPAGPDIGSASDGSAGATVVSEPSTVADSNMIPSSVAIAPPAVPPTSAQQAYMENLTALAFQHSFLSAVSATSGVVPNQQSQHLIGGLMGPFFALQQQVLQQQILQQLQVHHQQQQHRRPN